MYSISKTGLVALVGFLAVAAGWLTVSIVGQGSAGGLLALLVPVAAVVLLLLVARPVFAAIAVVGFAFVNPSLLPTLTEFAEFSIRYSDVMFSMLAFSMWMRIAIQHRIAVSQEFRALFVPLLPFLLYIGASLANVSFSSPDFLAASVASYLRLIVTAFFALLVHLALRNSHEVNVFHKALITLGVVSVAIGAWEAWLKLGVSDEAGLAGRFGGLLGVNSFGLVSGLLVLYAILKRVAWLTAFGLLGLFLAKSAGSTFATAGSVAVYMVVLHLRKGNVRGFITGSVILASLAAVAVLAVWIWRQSDVVGLLNISGGSFAHRLVATYAGLQIFLDHPLLGVGWQASSTEAIIGSPALNAILMERFATLTEIYFFLERVTSVHNMYIAFLSELGSIGFGLFVYGCFRTGKAAMKMVRNIPIGSPYKVLARFYALGLVFLLLWWNTNPLYGGQIESILAFTFIGALSSVARLEKRRVEGGIELIQTLQGHGLQ